MKQKTTKMIASDKNNKVFYQDLSQWKINESCIIDNMFTGCERMLANPDFLPIRVRSSLGL